MNDQTRKVLHSSDRDDWQIIHGDGFEWMRAQSEDAVDCIVTDPPYSSGTQNGHDALKSGDEAGRRQLDYSSWDVLQVTGFAQIAQFISSGWIVALSDNVLCCDYREQYTRHGLTGFAPVPCVISGMTVRLAGDGPSSWCIYANVARPKALSRWGTLPGAYVGKREKQPHIGGKPLWLMRAIIRDYTKPSDLVLDPYCGSGTTGVACLEMGRRFIGIDIDADACEIARERCAKAKQQPGLILTKPENAEQIGLLP